MYCVANLIQLLALVSVAVFAQTHQHAEEFSPDVILRVTRENHTVGNVGNRYLTLVNGSIPGPTLHILEGKVYWIRVYNDMSEANLTMHWHGLSLAAFPFSDGTPLSSQWPIPPLHFFDYEIRAAKGSAGTYFYHSHVDLQAISAAGPLVVVDLDSPPYRADGERIVMVQEIWNRTEQELIQGLQAFQFRWVKKPENFLVNGRSYCNKDKAATCGSRDGQNLATIDVEPGQTYRFRFIGAMGASLITMAFEDHPTMSIIQADGAYTKPLTVAALQMGPGQRYDAILRSKTCEQLRQLGKLEFYLQVENRAQRYFVPGLATLRYNATKCRFGKDEMNQTTEIPFDSLPLTLPPVDYGFLDYELKPLVDNNVDYQEETFPTSDQVTRRVVYTIQEIQRGYAFYIVNNVTLTDNESPYPAAYSMPSEPYLVSLYKNSTAYLPDYEAALANGGLDPRTKTYPARIGEVIEVVLQLYSSNRIDYRGERLKGVVTMHPWHVHGAKFWDAGGGDGAWDAETVESRLKGTQPVRRDTTILYGYPLPRNVSDVAAGWRVLRMRITQPGVWVMHCHTLPHVVQGLQTIWVHGDARDILKVGKPHVNGYLEYGGDAYGNVARSPSVVHFDDFDFDGLARAGLRVQKIQNGVYGRRVNGSG